MTDAPNLLSRAKRKLGLELRRLHGRVVLGIGAAARTSPLCPDFGGSRGTPIDRYYIERFLADHSADVRGRVLEVGDDSYSRRFGAGRVTKQDVLQLNERPGATIAGDLGKPGLLPAASFDCIILTQTLQLIYELEIAVDNLRSALAPGGTLLVTVPGISAIDRFEWRDSWYWSLTGTALRRLIERAFDPDDVTIATYGNLYAATTFLQGACVQEVSRRKLDLVDPAYPVTVGARAVARPA
ncbi:MAG TPA: hypothetical protein VFK58_04860 [Sphingomicrobium sp.]|nr:hypothetical protein [Sphingomicrobium sp.]